MAHAQCGTAQLPPRSAIATLSPFVLTCFSLVLSVEDFDPGTASQQLAPPARERRTGHAFRRRPTS
jgi:hypothetical protein